MCPAFKEIHTHLYSYLEYLFSEDENKEILFQYGPYLLMTCDTSKYRKHVLYSTKPVLKMLLDMSYVMKVCEEPSNSFAFIKKEILNILSELPNDESLQEFTYPVRAVCEKCISNMKSTQYTDKLLESAMINYRPIVPYTQVIKAPGMETMNIDQGPTITKVKQLLLQHQDNLENLLINILSSSFNAMDILKSNMNFIRPESNVSEYSVILEKGVGYTISSDIIDKVFPDTKCDMSLVYFILVYVHFNIKREDVPTFIDTLEAISKIYKGSVGFVSAMETLLKLDLPALEHSMFDEETIMNMEYEKDKQLEKIMDVANVDVFETSQYNLDDLMAFIFNSRKYQCDSYTNSLFLNDNNSISDYSYYGHGDKTLLICKIDNKNICVPVIDISDNYKMKMVTMNDDGEISVTNDFKSDK